MDEIAGIMREFGMGGNRKGKRRAKDSGMAVSGPPLLGRSHATCSIETKSMNRDAMYPKFAANRVAMRAGNRWKIHLHRDNRPVDILPRRQAHAFCRADVPRPADEEGHAPERQAVDAGDGLRGSAEEPRFLHAKGNAVRILVRIAGVFEDRDAPLPGRNADAGTEDEMRRRRYDMILI
ncbi:hypothetical protein ABW21_db0208868 [Orbilia brochopaga]|nr:hypothetical protein ABW21_db0208868 [Drechslerella brochopaga]